MGEVSNAYNILVGKPEGKRPAGRPTGWWKDKVDLEEMWWQRGRCVLVLKNKKFIDVQYIKMNSD
jgi:hypothetical protein